MKALTISQPFADLIASGEKWVENRTWGTDYRGKLAIHAGKGTQYLSAQDMRARNIATGAVIAVADLVACVREPNPRSGDFSAQTQRELEAVGIVAAALRDHPHAEGPWCWILRNARRVGPYPAKGALQLWDWDAPEAAALQGAPAAQMRLDL